MFNCIHFVKPRIFMNSPGCIFDGRSIYNILHFLSLTELKIFSPSANHTLASHFADLFISVREGSFTVVFLPKVFIIFVWRRKHGVNFFKGQMVFSVGKHPGSLLCNCELFHCSLTFKGVIVFHNTSAAKR